MAKGQVAESTEPSAKAPTTGWAIWAAAMVMVETQILGASADFAVVWESCNTKAIVVDPQIVLIAHIKGLGSLAAAFPNAGALG